MLFTSGNSTIGCPRLGQVSWILQRHFWRDLFSKYVYRLVSIKWMFVHLYMCIDLFGPFYNFIPVFLSISSMYKHICESFKTFLGINHLRFLGFFLTLSVGRSRPDCWWFVGCIFDEHLQGRWTSRLGWLRRNQAEHGEGAEVTDMVFSLGCVPLFAGMFSDAIHVGNMKSWWWQRGQPKV